MIEQRTLARPYAEAVFDLARDHGELVAWSERLEALRQVVTHADMQAAIDSPRVPRETVTALIIEACGDAFGDAGGNLVRLLVERRRLRAAPALADEFERLRAEEERTVEVEVRSAVALSEQRTQAIAAALKKRLDREVKLHCEIDPDLLGGAVIRAGDLVIDGSVRTQLQQLAHAVAH